jgi:CDP-glycerol glycerophosphotransferase (TagB/SpsB family)
MQRRIESSIPRAFAAASTFLQRVRRYARFRLIYTEGWLFSFVFLLLDLLVPNRKSLIVFGSSAGRVFCGNSKALYDYVRHDPGGLIAYYYVQKKAADRTDAHCLSGRGLRTFLLLLRARTVVSTHGTGDFWPYRFSRKTLFVQMWHGVGPKATGLTEATAAEEAQIERSIKIHRRWDVFVAPSKIAAYNMCACVRLDPRKVFLCGQPRNDVLLRERGSHGPLRTLLDRPFRKAILCCPTFRTGTAADFFPYEDFDNAALESFLDRQDAVLLLRSHINEKRGQGAARSDRIVEFSNAVCGDINTVLGDIDVLVTDYSSIYVDYLLLDRPIVFAPYDLQEFIRKRGLLFDDYDFWTPGPKVHSFSEWLRAVDEALDGSDPYGPLRKTINSLLNYYQSVDSCRQVIDMVRNRVGLAGDGTSGSQSVRERRNGRQTRPYSESTRAGAVHV